MDLLKAELERKRKAKAEEFGGQKYVKKAHITAVREVRPISHWFPYDRVRVVNAVP